MLCGCVSKKSQLVRTVIVAKCWVHRVQKTVNRSQIKTPESVIRLQIKLIVTNVDFIITKLFCGGGFCFRYHGVVLVKNPHIGFNTGTTKAQCIK